MSAPDLNALWDAAIAEMRANGEDVEALLAKAAANISAWRGRQLTDEEIAESAAAFAAADADERYPS